MLPRCMYTLPLVNADIPYECMSGHTWMVPRDWTFLIFKVLSEPPEAPPGGTVDWVAAEVAGGDPPATYSACCGPEDNTLRDVGNSPTRPASLAAWTMISNAGQTPLL